jgi:hypothetical protein
MGTRSLLIECDSSQLLRKLAKTRWVVRNAGATTSLQWCLRVNRHFATSTPMKRNIACMKKIVTLAFALILSASMSGFAQDQSGSSGQSSSGSSMGQSGSSSGQSGSTDQSGQTTKHKKHKKSSSTSGTSGSSSSSGGSMGNGSMGSGSSGSSSGSGSTSTPQ